MRLRFFQLYSCQLGLCSHWDCVLGPRSWGPGLFGLVQWDSSQGEKIVCVCSGLHACVWTAPLGILVTASFCSGGMRDTGVSAVFPSASAMGHVISSDMQHVRCDLRAPHLGSSWFSVHFAAQPPSPSRSDVPCPSCLVPWS